MAIKEAIRRPLTLKNTIQEYLWGSHTSIQQLMGVPKTGAPWAELWMGTHPKAPSQVKIDGKWMGLDALIRQFPDEFLGPSTAVKFNGALPFLFKILAAQHPLSIQAHPDKTRAAAGFVRETASGIALDHPARNYRDTALKGFRDTDDIKDILKRLCPDGIASLIPDAGASDLKGMGYKHEKPAAPFIRQLYVSLLCLPPDQKIRIIAETLENARQAAVKDPVSAWILRLYQYYPEDIGILGPALMNLVTLTPGQALFLESGELHAYLHGMGIEIMANSDNVLRAGLTVKHVDTEELLDAARFDPNPIEILAPQTVTPHESRYLVHAEEFVLSQIALKNETAYAAPEDRSVEILLCTGGTARLTHPELADETILKPGDSVIIPAQADPYHLNGEACIYKAGAPI